MKGFNVLILGRKAGEGIVFAINGVEVTVTVEKIKGHRVRLGIDAPGDVLIRRAEFEPLADKDLPSSGKVA